MMIAGLPFLSKNVREREQAVHQMRDDSYEQSLATKMAAQKDEARNARLSIKKAEWKHCIERVNASFMIC